jgi:hypothetical protein
MRDILVEGQLFHVNLKNKDHLNNPTVFSTLGLQSFLHTFVKSDNFELQGKIK